VSAYRRVGVTISLVMHIFDKPREVPHVPDDPNQEQDPTTPLSEHADTPTRRYADTSPQRVPVLSGKLRDIPKAS